MRPSSGVLLDEERVEVLPERALPYVNPETGASGLTFAELVAQLPDLYGG